MSKQASIQKCKNLKFQHNTPEDGLCLGPQTNPLFVEVVLENILKFLKGRSNALKLGKYRLVSKFWDREISKLIRRETQVNLKYILLPYPDGMGWTASKNENGSHYNVPYPEVRAFENIKLPFTNWDKFSLEENQLVKWFEVMGSEVKGICFESTLNKRDTECYKVLEKILKEWCPNLQSLTLAGVLFFESLIFASRFTNTTKGIICKDLKEVKISVKWNDGYAWKNPQKIPTLLAQSKSFNEMIYMHGLPGCNAEFTEYKNCTGMKANVPSELFKQSEFPNISQFIPENFFPKRLDGGILGQIIGCTSVQTFSLVGSTHSMNIRYLAAFFHYRKNIWRSSLKNLELDFVSIQNISRDLVVLGKLKYPLVTLKLKQGQDLELRNTRIDNVTRFIACCAETLQHLEYDGTFIWETGINKKFILPFLPKLKTFAYKNSCVLELCPVNIMTNLPNLKTLHLNVGPTIRRTETSFFQIETDNLRNNQLTDLKIPGMLSGAGGCKLLEWFPNLKSVKVSLQDTDDSILAFLRQLGTTKVEYLYMRWSTTTNKNRCVRKNTAFICEVNKLKNLKTLEMHFRYSTSPFLVNLAAFSEGFGLLTQLTALKLTNFGIYRKDYKEIKTCVADIPKKKFINLYVFSSTSKLTKKMNCIKPK